jgi:ribosomal protein L7Ae-like RNA K-turn-binding protein/predicted RNA-binding protein YlxR (DUF448 family)
MNEAAVHGTKSEQREGDLRPARARTCVGCGERVDPGATPDLVRLVLGPSGEIAVDARGRVGAGTGPKPPGGGFGRGAHVHARPDCLARAVRGGLSRVTKGKASAILGSSGAPQPISVEALAQAIAEAETRRLEGLFATAVRSKQVARGSEAVVEACRSGAAELVVIAGDAAAAAELSEVRRAAEEGRAVTWGDEQRLSRAVAWNPAQPNEAGVAVAAIVSRTIALAVRRTAAIIDACAAAKSAAPAASGRRKDVSRRRLSGVGSNVERGE